jgi:tetratricopeptide (TPR) repeat protein
MMAAQSTALYWFLGLVAKPARRNLNALLALVMLLSSSVFAQESQHFASLHGAVRDDQGKPIAQVDVFLQKKDANKLTTQTDQQGNYNFQKLPAGVYSLQASKRGHPPATLEALFLKSHESKTVDLTLGIQPGSASTSPPQFFDPPQFTVSGVTDTTNLGGHGSDTVVRTRNSLAKETVSLSGTTARNGTEAGDYLAAKATVEKELATHETAELHHRLADIGEKLGDSLDAVHHYQRAAELDPTESYLFDWGAELLLHHAPEPAEEVFSKGTQKYPNSSRMLLGLGATAFARGNTNGAIQRICRASDLNPSDAAPYLFLGKVEQSEIIPPGELIDKLHRFVTLQPQNADANYYYAVGLWKQRNRSPKPDTATQVESMLKTALQINPSHAPAQLQLGIVHTDQARYAEAISDYQKALQIDPTLDEAHYRLAQVYRQMGESDKAKEELRRYTQLSKESAQQLDRERHEIKQFVYTLRDQSGPQSR